jgi:magnesium-transporting ATPase (P-type)
MISSRLSSSLSRKQFNWDAIVLLVVTFWLSSSALLDFLFMPMMYESGMMNEPNFATAGYSLFWSFNRVEILCAAAILSCILALRQRPSQFEVVASGSRSRWALMLSGLLLAIALIYTYVLTPQMSALGLNLSDPWQLSEPVPQSMGYLHAFYWALEACKLTAAGFLIKLCYRDVAAVFE